MTHVKICGLKDQPSLAAAETAGAHFAGLVFYPKSPRAVNIETAAMLARATRLNTVGLFVDADDETLRETLRHVPLKMIQLHGHETPQRVAAIKSMTRLPVMKALRVATAADLKTVPEYEAVSDWLLFDAKISGAAMPGGTGQNFDWSILQNFKLTRPWMLAGGLTPENVGDALKALKPAAVDVSSGVESAPGVKDAGKITAFVDSVRHA